MNAYPPSANATGPTKLSGLALASFLLCITIVVLRVAALGAYVHAIGDVPGAKLDVASVAVGALVLGFYVWSAIGIKRGDPGGYQRLVRLSVVFGVIQIGYVVYHFTSIPGLSLLQGAYPLLWALIVPVPLGLGVLHLATAFVAYRAKTALVPADAYAFR